MKSVDLRSSVQDAACLSGSQGKEAVSDRMEIPSADTDKMHSGVETRAARFMLTLFLEGGLLCVKG